MKNLYVNTNPAQWLSGKHAGMNLFVGSIGMAFEGDGKMFVWTLIKKMFGRSEKLVKAQHDEGWSNVGMKIAEDFEGNAHIDDALKLVENNTIVSFPVDVANKVLFKLAIWGHPLTVLKGVRMLEAHCALCGPETINDGRIWQREDTEDVLLKAVKGINNLSVKLHLLHALYGNAIPVRLFMQAVEECSSGSDTGGIREIWERQQPHERRDIAEACARLGRWNLLLIFFGAAHQVPRTYAQLCLEECWPSGNYKKNPDQFVHMCIVAENWERGKELILIFREFIDAHQNAAELITPYLQGMKELLFALYGFGAIQVRLNQSPADTTADATT